MVDEFGQRGEVSINVCFNEVGTAKSRGVPGHQAIILSEAAVLELIAPTLGVAEQTVQEEEVLALLSFTGFAVGESTVRQLGRFEFRERGGEGAEGLSHGRDFSGLESMPKNIALALLSPLCIESIG